MRLYATSVAAHSGALKAARWTMSPRLIRLSACPNSIAAENEAVAFEEVWAGMGPTCSRAEVTKLDIQSKTSNPKPRQKLFADRD